ncbi:Lysophospholipase, alpha-beta hydrolase superfamily [Actinacidiphila rubida]|uniref:Lysophospholipase, alpha-beta hydrolase superfamily n=1 Tax=Actinacidiphila rubida TaxID=310780 RepID=A0A1H8JFF9_9ACTN|nr:alpha/beta hydrolase [Actinacidiphila rubida]SEN79583.1 Lysophospholipase, alpha-beta hydrolase superfamily [Actinacidiphila rubida]
MSMERENVRFTSGRDECAAWYYPGTDGSCVIMAGGLAVTKEPGTDQFARRFQEAGLGVLAFDYRGIGESGGRPRQVLPMRRQRADWHAALAFARTLPGVDPARIALWAFSASGGHVLRVAAETRDDAVPPAAVVAQTPNVGGFAATRHTTRHQKPLAMLRFTARGVLDALGGLVGRAPLLVPLNGRPGEVALITTPDAADTGPALNPGGRYPEWRQEVAARTGVALALYQPGRYAARIPCPLLVVVCDQDATAAPGPAAAAARRAPHGDVVHLPGGHYAPFLGAHEQALAAELSFLRAHLPAADAAPLA